MFVDSSAFLQIAEADVEAIGLLDALVTGRYGLLTTNSVVIEAHALVMSRRGILEGLEFLGSVEESRMIQIRTKPRDEHTAKAILRKYNDKDFSYTDAISFAVMGRVRLTMAFTYDAHFEQFGLTRATLANI